MIPPVEIPDAFEFVTTVNGIEEYRLTSNGLQVLLLPQNVAPVATVMITYRVGSRNESAGLTGATHFLEHLMFKGTSRYRKGQGTSVFQVLQEVGAQLNATTWVDRTNYYEMLPSSHVALALDVEADRMRGALLSEEDVASERTVILNEYDRGENDPIRKLFHTVWSHAFVAHPYHHPTIGWRSDIETVTAAGLRGFYDTFYWPDNATLSIIGGIDRGVVLEQVNRFFGSIPSGGMDGARRVTEEPEQLGERRVLVRKAGRIGALMMAFRSPHGRHEDADVLDVLAFILSTGKTSRLYRRLIDTGLTGHAYAANTRLHDPGLFYLFGSLNAGTRHEDAEEAFREVVARIQTEGVTVEELHKAHVALRAQERFARDGSFGVATRLNEAIAVGDWKLYAGYLDRIHKVTPGDVQRVAQTYLIPDASTVGYYVPRQEEQ